MISEISLAALLCASKRCACHADGGPFANAASVAFIFPLNEERRDLARSNSDFSSVVAPLPARVREVATAGSSVTVSGCRRWIIEAQPSNQREPVTSPRSTKLIETLILLG